MVRVCVFTRPASVLLVNSTFTCTESPSCSSMLQLESLTSDIAALGGLFIRVVLQPKQVVTFMTKSVGGGK